MNFTFYMLSDYSLNVKISKKNLNETKSRNSLKGALVKITSVHPHGADSFTMDEGTSRKSFKVKGILEVSSIARRTLA
jgi:hypothetical protein